MLNLTIHGSRVLWLHLGMLRLLLLLLLIPVGMGEIQGWGCHRPWASVDAEWNGGLCGAKVWVGKGICRRYALCRVEFQQLFEKVQS